MRSTVHRNPKFYSELPKVELHRHLEGSLRLNTMTEIARAHGLVVPSTGQLRSLVQVEEAQPFTYRNFLSKFETLRLFFQSPEIITRITREAVADAAADNVRYLELRFTPMALSKARGYPLSEVMGWVIDAASQSAEECSTTVRLIASVNRHEPVEAAEAVARAAADLISKGLVGLDLAGNEAEFSALPFEGVFREARQAGLRLTAHAGEWGGAGNVYDALETLKAERIGHGVRVTEDAAVVDLAIERGAVFEVCITSNYQSGVFSSLDDHPLMDMLALGLNATLNTDDPSISQIRLGDEYRLASESLSMPLDMLCQRILAAARAAFIPEPERQALVDTIKKELEAIIGERLL